MKSEKQDQLGRMAFNKRTPNTGPPAMSSARHNKQDKGTWAKKKTTKNIKYVNKINKDRRLSTNACKELSLPEKLT
jgi:hypothetical protein